MIQRIHLLFWCLAIGIFSYVCLDFWSQRNAPLFKRFERQWAADVELLEGSQKLPKAWYDVKDLELYGGTPESKEWLARVHVPLKTSPGGHHRLEVLVVVWEEDGKRGVLTQYNLVDLNTKNNIWELGRTLILAQAKPTSDWKALWHELSAQ